MIKDMAPVGMPPQDATSEVMHVVDRTAAFFVEEKPWDIGSDHRLQVVVGDFLDSCDLTEMTITHDVLALMGDRMRLAGTIAVSNKFGNGTKPTHLTWKQTESILFPNENPDYPQYNGEELLFRHTTVLACLLAVGSSVPEGSDHEGAVVNAVEEVMKKIERVSDATNVVVNN